MWICPNIDKMKIWDLHEEKVGLVFFSRRYLIFLLTTFRKSPICPLQVASRFCHLAITIVTRDKAWRRLEPLLFGPYIYTGTSAPLSWFWARWCVIAAIIVVAPDLKISFLILFRTGFHAFGKRWVSSRVFWFRCSICLFLLLFLSHFRFRL